MSMSMAAGRAANPERRFYQGMIVVIIACIVLGFSRSFFLRPLFPAAHAPRELFFYLHGAVFTVWLALLFTQASLVGAGNVALHRRLGVAGFVMVPLMIVLGLIGGTIAAHRPGGFIDIPTPPLAMWTTVALALPLVAWDLYSRKRIHPATAIGAVALLVEGPLREMISHTHVWLAFAKWASDLAA